MVFTGIKRAFTPATIANLIDSNKVRMAVRHFHAVFFRLRHSNEAGRLICESLACVGVYIETHLLWFAFVLWAWLVIDAFALYELIKTFMEGE